MHKGVLAVVSDFKPFHIVWAFPMQMEFYIRTTSKRIKVDCLIIYLNTTKQFKLCVHELKLGSVHTFFQLFLISVI